MSYSDDAVLAKLSTLNETQEGIVTVAQWLMFHKRNADRTATLWHKKLAEVNPARRVQLIYVVNEVVQQTRAKKKDEFANAFGPILPEALEMAYKGASNDVQGKIRYVVDVWKQRGVFSKQVQDRIEAKLDDFDKQRGTSGRSASAMIRSSGSTIPPDFQPSISAAHHLQKHRNATKAAITNADQSYATSTSLSQSSIDPPPVQAALLSSLLKSLATAEGAVKESIRTRKAVIDSLNKILTSHIQSLEDDRSKAQVLGDRVKEVELRKQEVENSIMRELSSGHSADGIDVANVPQGMKLELGSTTPPGLPAAEDMTPPPVEDFTPPGSPSIAVTANENRILPFLSTSLSSTDPTSQILPPLHPTSIRSPPGPFATSPTSATTPHSSHFPPGSAPLAHPEFAAAGAKRDSMSAFGTAAVGGEEDGTGGGGGGGGGKRKKSAHEQDEDVLMDGDAIEGFDEDLRELLRQESRSGGVRIA